jgi:tRNA (guanine37-N1)-methyltransferase
MNCEVLTLFPGIVEAAVGDSILKRAAEKGLVKIKVTDIRDFTRDKHKTADDAPFGGGPGMVMKPEPVFEAVEAATRAGVEGEAGEAEQGPGGAEAGTQRAPKKEAEAGAASGPKTRVILMSPQGPPFNHEKALELSKETRKLIFICGRYEGIDERVRTLADEELSLGDFVLSGGEIAAAAVIEATARLIPGVLGDEESAGLDSFYDGLLDYPHYTRPAEYRGLKVPDVLLSGNHAEIRRWRRKEALRATMKKRPDLLEKVTLTPEDRKLIEELERELNK